MYPCIRCDIDGISFDCCTNINNVKYFNMMCDFTVNNLYIDLCGNLNMRTPNSHNVYTVLQHITHSLLVPFGGADGWKNYLMKWYGSHELKNIEILMNNRYRKMMEYGFVAQ